MWQGEGEGEGELCVVRGCGCVQGVCVFAVCVLWGELQTLLDICLMIYRSQQQAPRRQREEWNIERKRKREAGGGIREEGRRCCSAVRNAQLTVSSCHCSKTLAICSMPRATVREVRHTNSVAKREKFECKFFRGGTYWNLKLV